jgi:membrane protein DedA with SNARE-associated domain
MGDAITNLVEGAMASPWVYVALLAFAAIDGFFPAVPSESLVITAGVFAATGEPDVFAVIGVSALGACVGDHVSYLLGRAAGRRPGVHGRPGSRRQAALARAGRLLDERGGQVLVVCRYIPGARTAITLTAGAVRYPLRRFSSFDALAALSWGAYATLLGYLGGAAFEDAPLKGLALGLGLALVVTLLVEAVRHARAPARPDGVSAPRRCACVGRPSRG